MDQDQIVASLREQARTHLEAGEFHDAVKALEEMLQLAQGTAEDRQRLNQALRGRDKQIDALLSEAVEAYQRSDWDTVDKNAREILTYDPGHQTARGYLASLTRERELSRQHSEVEQKVRMARSAMEEQEPEAYQKAIRLLREAHDAFPDDASIQQLLERAEKERAELLTRLGQVTTLMQAEQFDDALETIKDLIDQGVRRYEGRDIFEVQVDLERQIRNFSDAKATQYFEDAEQSLAASPETAVQKLKDAMALPMLSEERQKQLQAFLEEAQRQVDNRREAERLGDEALAIIGRDGDYRSALASLTKARTLDPHWPSLPHYETEIRRMQAAQAVADMQGLMVKARVTLQQKLYVEAQQHITQALELSAGVQGDDLANMVEQANAFLDRIVQDQRLDDEIQFLEKQIDGYVQQEQYALAEAELQRLEELAPQDARVRSLGIRLAGFRRETDVITQAENAFSRGDYSDARGLSEQLLIHNPGHPEARRLRDRAEAELMYRQGAAAQADGDLRLAQTSYERLAALDGDRSDRAVVALAEVKLLLQNDTEVLRALQQAQAYFNAGSYRDAFRLLEPIEQTPSSHMAPVTDLMFQARHAWRQELRRGILSALDEMQTDVALELAEQLREEAASADPDDRKLAHRAQVTHYCRRGEDLLHQQRWTEAREAWDMVLRLNPADLDAKAKRDHARAQEKLTDAKRALGQQRFQEAIDLLKQAEDAAPSNPEVLLLMAQTHLQAEHYDEARRYCERLELEDPFSPQVRDLKNDIFEAAAIHDHLAQADWKFKRGEYPEAMALVDELLESRPQNRELLSRKREMMIEAIETLLQRARSVAMDGSPVESLLIYMDILEIDPDHLETRSKLSAARMDAALHIEDLLHRADQTANAPHVTLQQVEVIYDALRKASQVCERTADPQFAGYKEPLGHWFQDIDRKRRLLQDVEQLLNRAREAMQRAKRTGEFNDVDHYLNEAKGKARQNRDVQELDREFGDYKAQHQRIAQSIAQLTTAFEQEDFDVVMRQARQLKRLDPDDAFHAQTMRVVAFDSHANEDVEGVEPIQQRAQDQKQNLEAIHRWQDSKFPSLSEVEQVYNESQELMTKGELERAAQLFQACADKSVRLLEAAEQSEDDPGLAPRSRQAQRLLDGIQQTLRRLQSLRQEALRNVEACQERIDQFETLLKQVQSLFELAQQSRGGLFNRRERGAPPVERIWPLVAQGLAIRPHHPGMRHYAHLIGFRAR